jgi:flavin-dependent dehydrogenase
MKHYDIAVVGGGPAGATFARELARMQPELKIAVIDEKPKTGSKVCGGLLAPDAQKVLAQFDLSLPKSILADPQIFDVETVDLCTGLSRNYQRHYLNMDRSKFDQWLLTLIPDHVDVINGRCISIEAGFQLHLHTEHGDDTVECDYLVGADGGSSIVRRTFFTPPKKQYVAIQEHFPDNGSDIPPYSCIFDPETSDSCSWTIRKDGYFIFGGAFQQNGCREAYQMQRQRLEAYLGVPFGQPIKREACLLTSIRSPRDFILGKDRVFLLGEAAGFVSPSSFEGISYALASAEGLAAALLRGGSKSKILHTYRKKTAALRAKVKLRCLKRPFMYNRFLRMLILKSGIGSLNLKGEKT